MLCLRKMSILDVFCVLPVGWVMDAECILIPACEHQHGTIWLRATHTRSERSVTSVVIDYRPVGGFVQPTLPSPYAIHIPVFKPPGDGRQAQISYLLSPSPGLLGLSQTRACLVATFFYVYLHPNFASFATGNTAGICVTPGSFFLFRYNLTSRLGNGR